MRPLVNSPSAIAATVDGIAVSLIAPCTVLDACHTAGVNVVALCHHESLAPSPTCDVCQVIVNGMLVRACTEPLRPGVAINTLGSAAQSARRVALARMSVGHPAACSTCHQSGGCELQTALARNAPVPLGQPAPAQLAPATHSPALGPLLRLHLDLCVGCTRCTRFVAEVLDRPLLTLPPGPVSSSRLHIDEAGALDVPYALALVELCPAGVFEPNNEALRAQPLWAQTAVPSVCAGCATGCPVWAHTMHGRVERVSSRGGAHFLCDDGYTLFAKPRPPRLAVPLAGNAVASWDSALDAASSLLAPALQNASLGVVLSAHCPTLDVAALSKLATENPGIYRTYVHRRDDGPAPPPLLSADKNPNSVAVATFAARPLSELRVDIESQKITALFWLDPEGLDVDQQPLLATALRSLSALVVASVFEGALCRLASVALPLAHFSETAGSFVNQAGLVQRFLPISAPLGDALPGWDLTNHLARRLGIELGFDDRQGVVRWLRRHHSTLVDSAGEA